MKEKNAKKGQQIQTNFDSSKMKCPAAVTVKIGGDFLVHKLRIDISLLPVPLHY